MNHEDIQSVRRAVRYYYDAGQIEREEWQRLDDVLQDAFDGTPAPLTPARLAEVIATAIEQAKAEITADIEKGVVPETINDFSELHSYVDANMYGGMDEIGERYGSLTMFQIGDAVQNAVHEWLQTRTRLMRP